VALIALGLFFGNGLIAAMEVTIPLYFQNVLSYSAGFIGLIYGINPVVYTISVVLFGFTGSKHGRWPYLLFGLVAMGLGCAGLLMFSHLAWFIAFWVLVGIGMAAIDSNSNSELADIADKRHKDCYGKIFSVSSTASSIGFIVGPVVSSLMLQPLSFRWTWTILGLILVAYAPFFLIRKCCKPSSNTFHPLKEVPAQTTV